MTAIDVSVVTYNSARWLEPLLASLAAQRDAPGLSLFVRDNGSQDDTVARLQGLGQQLAGRFATIDVEADARNLGFGAGHNRNLARGRAPFVLFLNPDLELEPDALAHLRVAVREAAPDVAAFELRQVPYEHPKRYDPVTGETGWCSGAAVLVRRDPLERMRGFDERIFLYGEDVDLSWRLRAAGFCLRYVPRAVARHYTYAEPHQLKPAQYLGSTLANLYLRTRFGSWGDVATGLGRYLALLAAPEAFRGRRHGLLGNLVRYLRHAPHFARGVAGGRRVAEFAGWDYGLMREGAFYAVSPPSARPDTPLVSVLVRTTGRPAVLAEALGSIAAQTYPAIEVVVVEDGPPASEAAVARHAGGRPVTYRATGARVGRCAAGNLALSLARGRYLAFLDDDDLLYADHVEVLVDAIRRHGCKAAYSLAREVPTEVTSLDPYRHTERWVDSHVVHRQAFSRPLLWHHNYMPIQSVLFDRSLYETEGGFDTDLENLEDWNLWTRYSLRHDFAFAPKETSLYRVPADRGEQARRAERMHAYLAAARRKQEAMLLTLTPAEVLGFHEELNRELGLVTVTPNDIRALFARLPGGTIAYPVLRDLYRRVRRATRRHAEPLPSQEPT